MRGLVVTIAIAGCGGGTAATPGDDAPTDGAATDGTPTDGAGDGPGTTADAPPDPCAPDTWCTETAPAAGILLRAVWAATTNDVFAVGDGGSIFHRRDNAWTAMTSNTTENLRGIWGLSASDIWAAGDNGALLHYDGTQWTPQGSFTVDFHGVWASATDDVWITAGGSVVHWNGQLFSSTNLPGTVFAISGTSATDLWATGEQAKVDHFTGAWTTGIDPGAGATYFAVLALPGEVWVSTFTPGKETLRFSGGTWTPKPATATVFQGFHAISATDIWAAGGNDVGHYDGASWTTESPAGNAASMFGIGGVGGSFWIVGSDSLILHRR